MFRARYLRFIHDSKENVIAAKHRKRTESKIEATVRRRRLSMPSAYCRSWKKTWVTKERDYSLLSTGGHRYYSSHIGSELPPYARLKD